MSVVSKPGFGLMLWSDVHGTYWCLSRSEDRDRVERLRDQLVAIRPDLVCAVVEALSDEAEDVLLAADASLFPPHGSFSDPAPDGVLWMPGQFAELVAAVQLECDYAYFRSDLWWAVAGDLPADVPLRSLFAHRLLLGSDTSDLLMPMSRG